MLKLKNLVLVKFTKDEMVTPRESEVSSWKQRAIQLLDTIDQLWRLASFKWFGFYKEGQAKELYTMEESPLYLNVSVYFALN